MRKKLYGLFLILILSFTGCANLSSMIFEGDKEVSYKELQFKSGVAYNVIDREITENDAPYTGRAIEMYEGTNNKKYETNFKKGKLNGVGKKFYENGKVKIELAYKDGKKNGVEKSYYESGELLSEIPFKNGVENGVAKTFYENKKLKSETNFDMGIKNGIAKSYYENGKIFEIEKYENGELGDVIRYDENGVETIY